MSTSSTSSIKTMLTGLLTLVTVMGIGRFSLTPQIPVMMNDGYLTLSSAGILAAMNYIGYLVGAIHVSRIKHSHAQYLKAGIMATVLVTLLSGTTGSFAIQCLFRLIAGVGGAWALIIVTAWTQMTLAGNNAPRLSAAVFTGPGVGIMLSGILAWLMATYHFHSSASWYVYGAVALIVSLLISRNLPAEFGAAKSQVTHHEPISANLKKLVVIYALAGFGYILPATFLSQMAHSAFPDGNQAAFFWPLFGLSAVAGVALIILFSARFNTQVSLATAMILQGLGVAAAVVVHNAAGLLISTILTGLGFLSIMQLTMRFAREISSGSVAKTVGILTSGYATGQLVGPLVSSASVALFGSLNEAIVLAALCLIAGGCSVMLLIRNPQPLAAQGQR
ncbi:YbfB/YjiJ family MFS transporter [Candidatus Pantoea bituminis]|uniref:YbfB/YjiJ family MFS transporter n=1 Tax=Candidatus Pantoea bituminis TaxID=2831036 RepID=UPI001C0631BD|nr:YbfB/YjiJ family MFS transporter [Pantoea bituminis]